MAADQRCRAHLSDSGPHLSLGMQLWLRAGAACLTTSWQGHAPASMPLPLYNQQGKLVITALWPASSSFVCQPWPLPMSAEGLIAAELAPSGETGAEAAAQAWLPLANIPHVESRERQVFADGRVIATLATKAIAKNVATDLARLVAIAPMERELVLGELLDRQMDRPRDRNSIGPAAHKHGLAQPELHAAVSTDVCLCAGFLLRDQPLGDLVSPAAHRRLDSGVAGYRRPIWSGTPSPLPRKFLATRLACLCRLLVTCFRHAHRGSRVARFAK